MDVLSAGLTAICEICYQIPVIKIKLPTKCINRHTSVVFLHSSCVFIFKLYHHRSPFLANLAIYIYSRTSETRSSSTSAPTSRRPSNTVKSRELKFLATGLGTTISLPSEFSIWKLRQRDATGTLTTMGNHSGCLHFTHQFAVFVSHQ